MARSPAQLRAIFAALRGSTLSKARSLRKQGLVRFGTHKLFTGKRMFPQGMGGSKSPAARKSKLEGALGLQLQYKMINRKRGTLRSGSFKPGHKF